MNPKKYHNLIRAKEAGCLVPDVLLLTEDRTTQGDYSDVASFIGKHVGQSFIVRSAAWGEDTASYANAGYFYSSGATAPENVVPEIKRAYTENRKRADAFSKGAHVDLMLMPFIEAELGGVAFCPWLYFYGHSLVAYAKTPQQAVAGMGTTEEIFAHDPEARGVTAPTFPYARALGEEILKLKSVFKEDIDIEWCVKDDAVYILQVRPVTIAPTSLTTVRALTYLGDISGLAKDEYALELGKLSPLSVELLNTLYRDAERYCRAVFIKGGTPFLKRLKNGDVVTESRARAQFFSDRQWFSAFLRALKKQSTLRALDAEERSWQAPRDITYDAMLRAFSNWHTAQTLETLGGKDRSVPTYPGEYELSHAPKNQSYGDTTRTARWKKIFMNSLLPLKSRVQGNPLLAWCPLGDVLTDTADLKTAQGAYSEELPESVYGIEFASLTSTDRHVSGPSYTATVKVIASPELWRGPLPRDIIIATTHIPSSWIPELQYLGGIAVTTLSSLSHAAIVLRERNIPTKVISQKTFATLQDGASFTV